MENELLPGRHRLRQGEHKETDADEGAPGAPELVDTWQQSDSAVPDVPCMVDKAVPHLHLRILRGRAVGKSPQK